MCSYDNFDDYEVGRQGDDEDDDCEDNVDDEEDDEENVKFISCVSTHTKACAQYRIHAKKTVCTVRQMKFLSFKNLKIIFNIASF